MTGSGRILRRIALAGIALLLGVFGVELAVGLLDPYGVLDGLHGERYRAELVELLPGSPRIFRHHPNRELRFRGWGIRTNGDGLRGPDRVKPKPPDVRRIVFVGDSVVFGWGVDAEDTFVSLVEEELGRRGGFRWECVNLGHQFHDTTQEEAALEEVGLSYEPDLVLLVFVDNDVVLTREVFAGKVGTPTESARRALRGLERLAKIRPLLPRTHALLQFLYVQATPESQTGSVQQAQALGLDVEKGWAEAQAAIRRMRDRSIERGARFAVLDLYRFDRLEAFCGTEAIPYASIAITEEERATGVRNSACDAHANPNGHRIYAGHILEALERLGLL